MGEEKQKSTPKFTYGNNYRRTRRETQFDTLDMAVCYAVRATSKAAYTGLPYQIPF